MTHKYLKHVKTYLSYSTKAKNLILLVCFLTVHPIDLFSNQILDLFKNLVEDL